MDQLSDLYTNYFHKSRVFLYPLLELPKGTGVTPIETYIRWDGKIHQNKMKLICVYHDRSDLEFKRVERDILEKHPMYHLTIIADGHKVIIFDFSKQEKDWNYFINGEYSKLSYQSKGKIKRFFGNKTENSVYVDSWLYPHKYFELYARFLREEVSTIKTVGELCDRPNMKKETFVSKAPVYDLKV